MSRLTDKYLLGARIGGGGMAEVLQATALGVEGFARQVAIKRILRGLLEDPATGSMFIAEARLAALLHHPNVVSVLDFDRDDDGCYFLVMELVQGLDLRALTQSGPLPHHVAAHIIGEVLLGLSHAHELVHEGRHLGIIHRDVSPHNVMISWDGGVKVVDFGIAKAVRASGASMPGSLKGKCAYMSPEQVAGRPLDGRADLFAVGVIFHELLTRARLFQGASDNEILSRVMTQPIAVPDGPPDFAAVCMKLLAREPRERYRSARAAVEALLACESASARASLELQEILRTRFADRAPRIPTAIRGRDRAAPRSLPASTPAASAGAPSRSAAHPPVATRTMTGPTPTAAGQKGATRTAARAATSQGGRHRSSMWIFGGVSFLAAAGVILFAALGGSGNGSGRTASPPPQTPELASGVSSSVPEQPGLRVGTVDAAPEPPLTDAVVDAATTAVPVAEEPQRKRRPRRSSKGRSQQPATQEKGTLELRVQPWARVLLDGKDKGTTPVTLELGVGSQTVVLENATLGRRETVQVTVESGESTWVRRQWTP